jgi:hypothetical protein
MTNMLSTPKENLRLEKSAQKSLPHHPHEEVDEDTIMKDV